MLLGKHNKRKLAVTIGSISLAALLLAACGQKEQQKSSIDVSINAELQTLDPSHIVESTGDEVLKNTQEGLLTVGKHNKLLPGIAKSWHVSADGKTYTFNLRHDAKWNNGQAITAADFVYSWQVTRSRTRCHCQEQVPIRRAHAASRGALPATSC